LKAAAVSVVALSAALGAVLVSGCASPGPRPAAATASLSSAAAPAPAPRTDTGSATGPASVATATRTAVSVATASSTPSSAPAAPRVTAAAPAAASHGSVVPGSVAAAVTPCQHNADAQLVLVVISQQRAWACSRAQQVYVSPVTTGNVATGDDTPTGTWQVQNKQTDRTLTLRDGTQYFVRYWMPYDDIYGFHDASWQTFPFGSAQYRTAGSHGCVHLPMAAMAWLYQWADIGATVTIRP
jgi:lipoprotein-anchoring transpeptidase ErfK/SrfK